MPVIYILLTLVFTLAFIVLGMNGVTAMERGNRTLSLVLIAGAILALWFADASIDATADSVAARKEAFQ